MTASTGEKMRSDHCVLVAPDSFKGTFTSAEVAASIARGIRAAEGVATELPVADGGEGTADVLLSACGGTLERMEVTGPLGDPVTAQFALLEDGRAVIDVASASGLLLIQQGAREAEAATSTGTGQLIAAAVSAGAKEVLLAAGGSATTDGGAGALAALARGGGLRGARVVVLCDVTTPFERAATTFAPQKGADIATVSRLSTRLLDFAETLPRNPVGVARTGAAGGLAGGLWGMYGAELRSGIDVVLEEIAFDGRLQQHATVVTGEGRLDSQTAEGKAIHGIITASRHRGRAVVAVVGSSTINDLEASTLGLNAVHVATASDDLEAAGYALMRSLLT